jgi:hypothetical protein
VPILPTLIQNSNSISSQSSNTRERNKMILVGGEKEVKLSLFAEDMILYLKKNKDSTKTTS